ncbi:MAG: hypothetical protein WC471_00830 [Candidatus Woesearchaeota archaeon]
MNKIITLIVIAMMVCMSGCTGSKTPTKAAVTPFIGGSDALKVSFVEGTPPAQIYDSGSSAFAIGLKLDNVGEHTVLATDGYVEILGLNAQDFGLGSQVDLKKSFVSDIRGAKKNLDGTTLEGDSVYMDFSDMKYLPDLKGDVEFKFRANLCYDYVTQTSSKICLNKNPLAGLGEAICKVSADKTVYNSGGPIQIVKVKESPLGNNKIQLLFEIGHKGSANNLFYKMGTACDDALTNTDRYKVLVKVTSDVNGATAQCSGLESAVSGSEGYVTLFGGKNRAITCVLDLAAVDSVYEDLFNVDLYYRYNQFLDKTIEIQDTGSS